MIASIQLNLK